MRAFLWAKVDCRKEPAPCLSYSRTKRQLCSCLLHHLWMIHGLQAVSASREALLKHQLLSRCRMQHSYLFFATSFRHPHMILIWWAVAQGSMLWFPGASLECVQCWQLCRLTSLPFTHITVIPLQSPRTYFCHCTWFIDGVGRFHASVYVVSYVAVQKPRSRVFCYKFNGLESPRKKVIHISSVAFVCLWQGKSSIVSVLPYCIQIPPRCWNIPIRLFTLWGR